jgi:hypothetical protein
MQIKPGKYRHFKGFICDVVGVGRSSENPEEEFVVYYHDSEDYGPRSLWVRPAAMFLENVEREDYSGPRFTYLGS